MDYSPTRSVLQKGMALLTVFLLCALPRGCCGYKHKSLYNNSRFVQELHPKSFRVLADSTVPWVIKCYSPVCPHCTRFAPTWNQVGENLTKTPVQVGALNCLNHQDLCWSLGVNKYPTLLAVNYLGSLSGTAESPAFKKLDVRGGPIEKIMGIINAVHPPAVEVDETPEDGVNGSPRRTEEPTRKHEQTAVQKRITKQLEQESAPCALRMEDAVVSVRWVLSYDVFDRGTELSPERKVVVLSFLDLLATSFPGNGNRASFRQLASELRRDPGLSKMSRWTKRVENFDIGSFAPTARPNWPAANIESKSDFYHVHYTAGLWALLHALSVSSAPERRHPYLIMEGIRSFVANFFRCEDCRGHFLDMYEARSNGRGNIPQANGIRGGQHPDEGEAALALWVWRMHNAVNTRLALDEGGQDRADKSLWPSADLCSECWNGFPPEENEAPWKESEVLKFLSATYSCPEDSWKAQDLKGSSWAIMCVVICAVVSSLVWARKWRQIRGVGLSKKLVDERT